jgi:hypothetical protein
MSYLLERRYEGVAPPISPTDFLLAVHDISVTQLTRDGLRYGRLVAQIVAFDAKHILLHEQCIATALR